jgi:hypothetical protein
LTPYRSTACPAADRLADCSLAGRTVDAFGITLKRGKLRALTAAISNAPVNQSPTASLSFLPDGFELGFQIDHDSLNGSDGLLNCRDVRDLLLRQRARLPPQGDNQIPTLFLQLDKRQAVIFKTVEHSGPPVPDEGPYRESVQTWLEIRRKF